MALTKDSRPKMVEDIYKTLDSLVMMADNAEEMAMLSVVLFIRARHVMVANYGKAKAIAMLEELAEELRDVKIT